VDADTRSRAAAVRKAARTVMMCERPVRR